MSIRLRLLISYALMIVVPLVLLFAFMHIIYHLCVGEANDIKKYYNAENRTLEQFLQDEVVTFAKLQLDVMNNPDRLLESGVLESYDEKFSKRQTGLLLVKDGQILYRSAIIDSEDAAKISGYETENSLRYNYTERSLYINDKWMISLSFPVHYKDDTKANLYVVIDTNPISNFFNTLLPVLIIVFIITFIAVNIAITYWMSCHLLVPIRKLKEAAKQVKDGNLEFSPTIKRKDELGELGEAFDEMRLRLKESIEGQLKDEDNRKQLITNISHDLRTPITTIKGYVNGIKDGVANNPEKLVDYMNTILEKTSDLDHMIEELFLYSKLDADSVPFTYTEVDLDSYLKEYVETNSNELESLSIQLNYRYLLDKKVKVAADREKLKRVITNVVHNSIASVHGSDKQIMIEVTHGNNTGIAQISIKDNGVGIEEKDLPHVFERFYRADASRNRTSGGSGLGLAIAKQIIEAHGGTISIRSEAGVGTTVYFTLRIINP
ncbi:cell wall metabolism sensor histidine kinase WalK [Paenibacillus sp. L3-i20]|uniref:sensor histidine kinase n=1 Tax=Paenibacillus sp. L3-i20 TaxID=2905833 RepID=UPI001EDEBEFE|nr:HAMP domain-containing sensor histidine kinase [Paenibacillus sp. L3-i20]GKU77149.1 two-component sensor histidine kinase [Paenibacillus sp. L3-i20]